METAYGEYVPSIKNLIKYIASENVVDTINVAFHGRVHVLEFISG